MSPNFIPQVLDQLTVKGHDLRTLQYVVPSRRVGVFINHNISSRYDQPFFAPKIQSIEEFIQDKAGLHILPDLEVLPHFYQAYLKVEGGNQSDSFDSFLGWAPTILKDFNEVDRYLIQADSFFDYLGNYKALDTDRHWSLQADQTLMITRYLDFWKKLGLYYKELQQLLLQQEVAYQGMAFRKAAENIADNNATPSPRNDDTSVNSVVNQKTVFLGLNALNTAEEQIIQQLLDAGDALIFWDTDEHFLERNYHEAGTFIRQHLKNWKFYRENSLELIGNQYSDHKKIEIVSATGNLGMVQAARTILAQLHPDQLKDTAVVLADESLLLPLLSAIPQNISSFNITMGLSLDQMPLSSFVIDIFQLHKNSIDGTFYFKDLLKVLESSFAFQLSPDQVTTALNDIRTNNLITIDASDFSSEKFEFINLLLKPILQPESLIDLVIGLLQRLKQEYLKDRNNLLELEQILAMKEVLLELDDLIQRNEGIKEMRTVHHLLRQLLPLKKLDFIGEPVQGLQIMGLLETRALDYKHIIMLSINEGVLPAGKSFSSYIPYDMKRAFDLPTYSEKDSVYAYHFYRLLHRCEDIVCIYNAESDTLGGGEKSRFLLQLEREQLEKHEITHTNFYYKVGDASREPIEISKEPLYENRLREIATKGFSPSALTSYIRNPIDFFSNKIIAVTDLEDVEEDIALNTMGSIIHEALDQLYQPVVNRILTNDDFKSIKAGIAEQVKLAYDKYYPSKTEPVGKNKIIYEVSLHYVKKMIDADLQVVQDGNELIIKSVEQDLATYLELPGVGRIKLHGKVDRVDSMNGKLRILDYKTGYVQKRNVGIEADGYHVLIEDYDKSKAFQVLMYAYLYMKNFPCNEVEAGIISFKNFAIGPITFAIKTGRSYQPQAIDEEILEHFEQQLNFLLQEIFDMNLHLMEKEV